MDRRLETLRAALEDRDADDFATEAAAEDTLRRLKSELVELAAAAQAHGSPDRVERALRRLAEHTGCAADVRLLEDVLRPLQEEGRLPRDTLERILDESPAARWR